MRYRVESFESETYMGGIGMKKSFVFIVIAAMHVVVVGGFLLIQGCQSARPVRVDPPPAPVLPIDDADDIVDRTPGPRVAPPVVVPERPETRAQVQTYTVRSGDVLSRIAARYGVSTRELAEINSISDSDTIYVGQRLVLPAYARTDVEETRVSTPSDAPAAPSTREPQVRPGDEYEVVAGDVLSRIAVRHGTTTRAIMELNNLDSTKIIVGQKLRIPAQDGDSLPAPRTDERPTPPSPDPETPQVDDEPEVEIPVPQAESQPRVSDRPSTPAPAARTDGGLYSTADYYVYTVAQGDTLMRIAGTFAVDPHELRRINDMSRDDEVVAGQQLKIPLGDL